MVETTNVLISDILKKMPQPASEFKSKNLVKINLDDLTYFEDLLEESSLPTYICMLEKDYYAADRNKGDIDERLSLNEDDSLVGSGSLSGGVVCMSGTKRKFDTIAYLVEMFVYGGKPSSQAITSVMLVSGNQIKNLENILGCCSAIDADVGLLVHHFRRNTLYCTWKD